MNMGMNLRRSAVWYPERTAIVSEGKRITYRELNSRTNSLSNALASLGLKKGDRVALLSPNRHQLIESAYACWKRGFIKVPLNFRLSMSELVEMLNNSEARVLILGEEFIDAVISTRSDLKTVEYLICMRNTPDGLLDYETLIADSPDDEPVAEIGPDDIASLNYTSGTTGVLKAAKHTHRNRISSARKMLLAGGMNIDTDSVMCHVAPVTHGSSTMILPIIWHGGRAVLLDGFDVPELLKTIESEKVTHLLVVPTMINVMLMHSDLPKTDLSNIKTIVYTASPMPVKRIREAIEVFGPVLMQMYALTETAGAVTWLTKEDHMIGDDPVKIRRLASAGRPSIESEVRIVDENGRDVEPGEVGEIIERGDDTTPGYWKAPELTAKMLSEDGWIHTKDMAREDEDGYIYIVDRKFDMIISGGFNVYPSEVENALYQHPAVFEAAVVGVPDDLWGESVKAFVVLKEGMEAPAEELIEHCKNFVSSYKKPKTVEFISELPKNPYGKILKRVLREKYWEGQERKGVH